MNDKRFMDRLRRLAQAVNSVSSALTFTIMEIGALPLGGEREVFHHLVELFPGSRLIAFELEESLCAELNSKCPPEVSYFPVALGRSEERRLLFLTRHPMCCSLFKPQEELLRQYHNLEVSMLDSVTSLDTVSLDYFVTKHHINDVDFVKIDIQGAELEVFQGGTTALKNVVAIVTEVEFIPMYYKQPLFGDICQFLTDQGLMFHKFLGMAGRTLQPLIVDNNPNFASQHMWSDAVFIRNILALTGLSSEKLLKMGILSYLYNSPDVTYRCFEIYDERNQSSLCQQLLEL
jgi:FkbM family methyltransferase